MKSCALSCVGRSPTEREVLMWDDGEKLSCRKEPSKVCAAASTTSPR
nr:MAG TPA: hypothetical protein [Caudoviricetes sp.]